MRRFAAARQNIVKRAVDDFVCGELFHLRQQAVDAGFDHRDIERVQFAQILDYVAGIDGSVQGKEFLPPGKDGFSLLLRLFHEPAPAP